MTASPAVLVALVVVAFAAGLVDAIAGGGGLLTVPALLVAVPDPRVALGTNKGQSVFGSLTALAKYARAGRVDGRRALPSFVAAAAGAVVGARLVVSIAPETLRPVVMALLVVVAITIGLRGRRRDDAASASRPRGMRVAREHPIAAASAIGLVLGLYDGFFGPGTGTFLIVAYVSVFGDEMTTATANAKVANVASNLASVATFALAGKIDFHLAAPMAAAQIAGGYVGAHFAIKGGERLIRGAVVLVSVALVARLGYQALQGATP